VALRVLILAPRDRPAIAAEVRSRFGGEAEVVSGRWEPGVELGLAYAD
jgi:hypothetical protein